MKLVRFGISFVAFLLIYSLISTLMDRIFLNDYDSVTYTIRRMIQLCLNIGYLVYILQRSQLRLHYRVQPFNLIMYIVILLACMSVYEVTIGNLIAQWVTPNGTSVAREDSIMDLFLYPLPLFIQACISAPLLEEVLVRGILYEILQESVSKVWSVVICSVFFSVMHFDSYNTLFYIMISVIFASIYIKTKSITYCVLLHACVNGISFLSYYGLIPFIYSS